ncbi:MAG: hypothetical protein V4819_03750 [Verrucomicrobiota bacterium]
MPWRNFPVDVLIDGEAIGDTFHAFDLLELKGSNIHQRPYLPSMNHHQGQRPPHRNPAAPPASVFHRQNHPPFPIAPNL